MISLLTLIPDGPLHPGDAAWAICVGLLLGGAIRRTTVVWLIAVSIAGPALFELRYPGVLAEGFTDRPSPVWPALAVVASVAAGMILIPLLELSLREVATLSLFATGLVWAVVPDTEAAVVLGGVLLASLVWVPSTAPARAGALLCSVPVAAAVVGSVGRPSTLGSALALSACATACGGALLLVVRRQLRGRAGEPTTVAPASTSSTTTAPAPITAP